ncbi:MAG: acyltransferase [Sphingobacteriales bacterium]|nr:acyltransferase [Sphingobacteriales bacterium]
MLVPQPKYFRNLDGLRFLCFLSVFASHSLHTSNPDVVSNIFYRIIVDGIFNNGYLGVNFFFVLSGFLITYLLIIEKQETGKINILNFWMKRMFRIWPLYFICIIYGFIIYPYIKGLLGEGKTGLPDVSFYLLFMSNFDIIKNGLPDSTQLGVLWSISVEEQFYLVWPLILFMLPIKRYWIVFTVIIICSLIFRAVYNDDLSHYFHTLSCMSDLAIGGLGAWLMQQDRFKKVITNLDIRYIILVYISFAVCFMFRKEILSEVFILRIFERLIISIFIVLIILEQNYSVSSFYKMGNFKRISSLGLTTYGMYMLHIIFFVILVKASKLIKLGDNYFVVLWIPILSLILTVVFSKISYNVFEKPFLGLRRYLK